jgi:hypothetical protein
MAVWCTNTLTKDSGPVRRPWCEMKSSPIGRRSFLSGAVAAAAAGLTQGGASGQSPSTSRTAQAAQLGEPYELLGNRLFFTNWYHIRPGSFTWRDEAGKAVGLKSEVPRGAAHLTHTDQPFGIRLIAQPAQKIGPLIEAERPWEEGAGVALTTVIRDGGMFRGWGAPFTTSGDPPGQRYFYYLESHDGLSWVRPNLGIVDVNGSRANNVVNIFDTDGGSIFLDPSAPASERFKLIAEGPFPPDVIAAYKRQRPGDWDSKITESGTDRSKGVKGAVSADGVHWKMFPEPLVMEMTDTQLTGYFDAQLRKYVIYTRTWATGPRSPRAVQHEQQMRSDLPVKASNWWNVGRRSIGRSESSDYRQFPMHEMILEPGPDLLPSDVLYTNCKTAMPGAPDHHLLFPTIWHTANDTTSVTLAASHDGKMWHFVPGAPVLEPGPMGAFDGGCLFAHPNLLELADGRFVLPYTGYSVPHKYPRKLWKYAPGYAVWPKGRVIALEAREYGEFATVGLVPPGRKLRINALTPAGGSILVEVAGMDGKPLPGRSFAQAKRIIGDQHWTPVVWGGQEDLGFEDGAGIILRFRLDHAQLYGLEFA